MANRAEALRLEDLGRGAALHEIRLELARGPGHPLGRADIGYVLVAPSIGRAGSIPTFGTSSGKRVG